MVSSMISSAPPVQADCVDVTHKVQEAIFEILHIIWEL